MENNDLVFIKLDRERIIRFGHKAFKMLCAMYNTSFEDIETILDNPGPEDIEKIMYCGLLSDAKSNNETLKMEDMEDILDLAVSYEEITVKMTEAVVAAFPNQKLANQHATTVKKK